jgi:hypothetical protein
MGITNIFIPLLTITAPSYVINHVARFVFDREHILLNETCVIVCAVSCMIALLSEYLALSLLYFAIFKTTAAVSFVVLAVNNWKYTIINSDISAMAETNSKRMRQTSGGIILVGLTFSLMGDILLVWSEVHDLFFLVGGLFFTCAHLCYMIAYVTLLLKRNVDTIRWNWLVGMSIFMSCATYYCLVIYVLPYVPPGSVMGIFVWVYAIMLSTMVALSPAGEGISTLKSNSIASQQEEVKTNNTDLEYYNLKFICRVFGSVLFYLSDLFVARQKFVVSEFVNILLGLPLYFLAQILIASSI